MLACDVAQFEATAATVTSDRTCAAPGPCTDDQVESVAPTSTSDRECVAKCTSGFEFVDAVNGDFNCDAIPCANGDVSINM